VGHVCPHEMCREKVVQAKGSEIKEGGEGPPHLLVVVVVVVFFGGEGSDGIMCVCFFGGGMMGFVCGGYVFVRRLYVCVCGMVDVGLGVWGESIGASMVGRQKLASAKSACSVSNATARPHPCTISLSPYTQQQPQQQLPTYVYIYTYIHTYIYTYVYIHTCIPGGA
jgi:hypothetical protein